MKGSPGSTKAATAAFLVGICLALWGLVAVLLKSPHTGAEPPNAAAQWSSELNQPEFPVRPVGLSSTREESENEEAQGSLDPPEFFGRVSCAMTYQPIVARFVGVAPSGRTLTVGVSDPDTGEFRFRIRDESLREVSVHAAGYLAVVLSTDLVVAGEDIKLKPAGTCAISVVDSSKRAASGCSIFSLGEDGGMTRQLGVTDSAGEAVVPVGVAIQVVASKGGLASSPQLISPGGQHLLTLARSSKLAVKFVDAETQEPVQDVGFEFESLDLVDQVKGSWRTGSNAVASVPSSSRRFWLRAEAHLGLRQFSHPGVAGIPHRRGLLVTISDELLLEVRIPTSAQKARQVILVDSQQGTTIPVGSAWTEFFVGPDLGWVKNSGPVTLSASSSGSSIANLNLGSYVGSPVRLTIGAAGYHSIHVDAPWEALEPGVSWTALMDPAKERWLQIPTACMADMRFGVVVRSAVSGADLYHGRPDGEGLIGPIDWPGESLTLHGGPGWAHLETIERNALALERVVAVPLDCFGTIRVESESVSAWRLSCIDDEGRRFSRQFERGQAVFYGLPAGRYLVDYPEQLSLARFYAVQGRTLDWLQLESGEDRVFEHVETEPQPEERDALSLAGTVIVPTGQEQGLFVALVFEDAAYPLMGGGHMRTPLNLDGSWSVAPMGPEPSGYFLGILDGLGNEFPLAICYQSDITTVDLRRLCIRFPQAAWTESFVLGIESRLSERPTLAVRREFGVASEFVMVDHVLADTKSVTLRLADQKERILVLTTSANGELSAEAP